MTAHVISSRGMRVWLAALLAAIALTQPAYAAVVRAEPSTLAPLPPRGTWGAAVWSGGTIDVLQATALADGCTVTSLWVTGPDGRFLRFIPGAPAYANAAWDAAIGASLPAGTPLIVACEGPASPEPAPSIFTNARVVSYYGYPNAPTLGALGTGTPEQIADAVIAQAREYDALRDGRTAIPAFHLIVALAHPVPGDDDTYVTHLGAEVIDAYVRIAAERGMQIFLDTQLGWADPLAEVQRLGPWLTLPFVHVALDPEYGTRVKGDPPGDAIGEVSATDVERVQAFLAAIVREHQLPPKVLVLHEFCEDMLPNPVYIDHPEVDVLIDMDGFGAPTIKTVKYHQFAGAPYAERAGIKLFFRWDRPLLTPAEAIALEPSPDLVIYQ